MDDGPAPDGRAPGELTGAPRGRLHVVRRARPRASLGSVVATVVTAAALTGALGTAVAMRSHGGGGGPAVAGASSGTANPGGVAGVAPSPPSGGNRTAPGPSPGSGGSVGATAVAGGPVTPQVVVASPATAAATPAGPAPASPPPPPTPSPPGTSPTSGRLVFTESDSGRSVTVSRGTEIEVDLGGASQSQPWGEPQTSDGTALPRTSASTSSDGSAHGLFRAAAGGHATITSAQAPPPCYYQHPGCLPPQRGFTLDVTVTG